MVYAILNLAYPKGHVFALRSTYIVYIIYYCYNLKTLELVNKKNLILG